jgi:hypothetical protein
MSITPSLYAKARSEIIALFGWNADGLSPDQTLRIDCAVALRLALDDLQGRIVRGESADVSRMLTASEALSRLLPPAVLAAPPAEQRDDHEAAIAPLLKLYRYLHESVHTLSAENAQLRAALGGSGNFHIGTAVTKSAIDPPTSDIVPASERAECDAGVKPGPDDWRAQRSTTVIEGRANPPAAKARHASPASWDDTPNGRAWNEWLDSGGYGGPGYDRWADNRT